MQPDTSAALKGGADVFRFDANSSSFIHKPTRILCYNRGVDEMLQASPLPLPMLRRISRICQRQQWFVDQ